MARTRGGKPLSSGKRQRNRSEESSDDDFFPLPSDGSSSAAGEDSQPEEAKVANARRPIRRRKKISVKKAANDLEFEGGEDDDPPPAVDPPQLKMKKPKKNRRKKKRHGSEDPPLIWQILEEEHERWLDEHEKMLGRDFEQGPLAEVAEPTPDVILPLLRFQKEWLAWALKQEESNARGGILADEMGMGKTIQAISLVLTARNLRQTIESFDCNVASCSSSPWVPVLPRNKCTLVICPVVAVIQWVGEIEKYTRKGSTRVLVYHGAKRNHLAYDFNDYDFVLTTYPTIEGDYRKHMMPPKEKCKWCGKQLYPKKMRIHLLYHCGPDAKKTEKQSKQTRKKKDRGYFENKNKEDMPIDNSVDSSCGKSVLHSVHWERIILDEAHFIKSRQSNTARAVFSLESSYKWALSGTPLQNRVGELYSLVRYLQINPYSFYFCKDCDCKVLDYGHVAHCLNCVHSNTRHFCWWNRYITKPTQNHGHMNEGRRAMILLKEKVLKSIVLRRTKKGRAADLALPPRIVSLRRDMLDINEQEFYEAMYTQSLTQFDTYVAAGTLMNNYAHVFDLLTRLRQAVNHPYLVVYSKTGEMVRESKEDGAKFICGICYDPAEETVVTSCEHVFCKTCLIDYSATLGEASCPSCSKPLTVDLLTRKSPGEKSVKTTVKGFKSSSILNRLNIEEFKRSTKIDGLREEIRNMLEADVSAKGIVFSQFTSFLDLINYSLQMSGIKCVQLVGSMSLAEREKAINTYTDDADCKIFLMSLKAGGVALNLTVASHVFLMDPWWNPAVESQAQDRIHRIGQYKPIRTVRFVIGGTIEERILRLQEKKKLVFEGTVGDSFEALAKLSEGDLKFLFHN